MRCLTCYQENHIRDWIEIKRVSMHTRKLKLKTKSLFGCPSCGTIRISDTEINIIKELRSEHNV